MMEDTTSTELLNDPDLDGELVSIRLLSAQDKRWVLGLEVRANGDAYKESRHVFLTDFHQFLGIADQIRSALLPTMDAEILASLDRIEKKLNEWTRQAPSGKFGQGDLSGASLTAGPFYFKLDETALHSCLSLDLSRSTLPFDQRAAL